MNTTCNKAIQLFTYLKELAKLRTTHVKDISRYDQILWFSDIPREKGCYSVVWELWEQREDKKEERSDVWIEVHKPKPRSAPEVPDDLEPWIKEEEISNSELEEPGLYDKIVSVSDQDPETGEEQTETLDINDHPEIFEMWMDYVENKWKPWMEEDRRLQKIQKVYNDLYTIYQRAEKLGEQYEVQVGLGFLQWRSPKSGEIRHPLLAFQAIVAFDRVRGIMSVGPALNGPEPKLEIDMLETDDRPSVQDQQAIQGMVDELNGEPWDGPALDAILKSLANGISTESQYNKSILRPVQISEVPHLHFAPSLILRKRMRRTFIDFYGKIVEQLNVAREVPEGVRRLVEIVDDNEPSDERDPTVNSSQIQAHDMELYFPLLANDEQKRIAQRIEQSRGVLVQGPPGTGKSHTIANLIAHFLAKGQRVLVTSETPRALEVLKEKLPEEIRELCVMWLGSDPQAQKSLEASVHSITQKKVDWDAEYTTREISDLQRRLDEARREQANLWGKLMACREADTYQHTNVFGVYSGTLEKIAILVNKEREQFRWFLDRPETKQEITVTSSELLELVKTHRQLTKDLVTEIKMRHLSPDDLIPPANFRKLVSKEKDMIALQKKAHSKRDYPGYASLRSTNPDRRDQMLELLNSVVNRMDELAKHIHTWADRAAREIVADQDRVWKQLLGVTQEHIHALTDRSQEISGLHIVGLEGYDHAEVALNAQELKAHLDSGKGLGFGGLFRPKVVRRAWYLKNIRVDGEPCLSASALQKLLDWLDFEKRLGELADQWKTYTKPPTGNYARQIAAYEDLCEPLQDAIALHEMVQQLKGFVSQMPDLVSPHWHLSSEVKALRDAVEAVDADDQLRQLQETFIPLERTILGFLEQPDAHPATRQALDAIRARDTSVYERAWTIISRMNKWVQVYKGISGILQRFQTSSPKTAAEYKKSFQDETWKDRFKDFHLAWNWAKTDRWLQDMCGDNKARQLTEALEHIQAEERMILSKLAAQKAWQHCMRSLGEPERLALMAWKQAVGKIRGGTGRHAERHREEARQRLTECRKAIPAWVMPLYQVVQTTNPQKGLFDIVIVDEASQSGPEALLLNYIGEKIIVVGDDKQIAPLYVGVNRDDVIRLRQMYLKGIPYDEAFDLEGSLFSQADLRFPGRVQLREHFRCMPEIIQFSNNLSYNTDPLIPLRQFGADRLEPLKTTHVADGYRTGRSPNIVNKPEAQALVDQIVECLEDPAYEGKTFGVISLLGNIQASTIANILMQEVGPDEIEVRKLLCGSPYDFQGDERDVIFLSMVDAPQDGRTCRMIRDAETQRRFNVAASRAKDQLWLFHSPTLNNLRIECLRHRLLEHCLNPKVNQPTVGDLNLEDLRRLANSEARNRNAPGPFDSWFEVDVFLIIAERGYRVLPQYEVAGRKIDLVIEGLEGRLAVECYGDKWHGPDQFRKDTERQRQLERCGWTFEIIWGSQFYRNPDVALQPLWEKLDDRGIFPEKRWVEIMRKKFDTLPTSADDYPPGIEKATDLTALKTDELSSAVADKADLEDSNGDEDYPMMEDRLGRAIEYDRKRRKHRPEILSARTIQQAIVAALEKCPNNTCTKKSITSRVLKELGIITRGNPLAVFEKRVKRNVGTLKRKGLVEEYKAKNKRLRLLHSAQNRTLF